MTERATFGNFLDAAREQLDHAGRISGRPRDGMDLVDVTRGMHALVRVIGRYMQKDVVLHDCNGDNQADSASPWPTARVRACLAATKAASYLQPPPMARSSGEARFTERGQRMNAAAQALAAGHDLLATHVAADLDGVRVGRSVWATVVCSPQVGRAVVAEIGALARDAGAFGAGLVIVAPAWDTTSEPRRNLAAACQYLRVLAGAVQQAHQDEPVLADDHDLVRAIPSALVPPRRLPDGGESIAELGKGVISAAERLSHSARLAAAQSGWFPGVSSESLRHAAAASVATSHHCAVLLGIVSGRSEAADPARWTPQCQAAPLNGAAEASAQGRDAWLRVARALDQVTTDVRGHSASDSAAAQDLALWTGRLAYTDPQWTLASGPRSTERTATELAAGQESLALLVSAVHSATESLARLAEAHEVMARSASQAGRFHVPTRSLPDNYDIPRPYGPAPPDRLGVIIAAYRNARQANSEARAQMEKAAAMTRSPSTVLTRAREVALAQEQNEQRGGSHRRREGTLRTVAGYEPPAVPGPVERSLQMLGVTDADQVRRAIIIDRAGEQLIIDASTQRDWRPANFPEPGTPINDVTYGGPRPSAAALTDGPGRIAPMRRENPERQPE